MKKNYTKTLNLALSNLSSNTEVKIYTHPY